MSTTPARAPRGETHYTTALSANDAFTLARRFSIALAAVAGAASAAALAFPSIFHDPPATVGNARGTALIVLLVAIPATLISMPRAARGSLRAIFVWAGAVAYLAYNAVIHVFGLEFNSLFLLYIAWLSLAVWSLVALLARFPLERLPHAFDPRLRVRAIGGYMTFIGVAFAGLWLSDVIPAVLSNTRPAALAGTNFLTNPIHVVELGFSLPLSILGGLWLWRRRARGYVASGILLVMLAIEGASVAADQTFGHLADPSQPTATIWFFVVLTVIGLVPTVAFLRAARGPMQEA